MPEIAQEKNAQIKEITDKLEQGIQNLFEGERFKEYLNVMSKFHNYSYKNTMLIAMQNPTASRVAGFNSWKNKFGRTVTKGEKGIQILAPAPFKVEREQEKLDNDTGLPMLDRNGNPIIETVEVAIPYFKVVNVFDVSQTYGKELPTLGADELSGGVKDFDRFFEALKTVSPAPIEFEKIEDGGKGYYHHEKKLIAINEDMSEVQTAKTAIHEIAHAKLHDRDLVKSELAEPKDKRTMEVEAEAVAYTVCQHYGIDTSDYSFAYIAEWGSGKDMTELKSSLETIRTTANELITKIDDIFLDKAQEKSQTQEQSEKPDKKDIIGNTPYKDIVDKNYFKIDNNAADKVKSALEVMGVNFSGRVGKTTTTFTVGGDDVARFKEAEKAATNHKTPPVKNKAPLEIIGTVKFAEIVDKTYSKLDNTLAVKVAQELESQGFRFSGRVNGDKTTFTLEKSDMTSYKAVVAAVRTAEAELKVADKFPEKDVLENAAITPVYLETLRHAVEVDGDKMLYHNSHKLNCECAETLDKAISGNAEYRGMPGAYTYDFDTALKNVTAEYGVERVTAVVAHTVNKHDWDGRLSDQNKEWAKTVDTPKVDYIPLNTHLSVFDGFVNCVRVEHEREAIITALLDNLQNGEPEDYGGAAGFAVIEANLREKSIDELRADFKEMQSFDIHEYADPSAEVVEANHRAESPTLSELETKAHNGEAVSVLDVAKATKVENVPTKVAKKPREKKSIKAAIEADKAEKRNQSKPVPTAERKSKGEAEL